MTKRQRDLLIRALNAAGTAPEWIEVLPAGPDIKGEDGRAWRMSDPARVVKDSQSRLPLVLDYEHASEIVAPKGGEAPAAGWIKALDVRDGAIWAQVEWTPRAANMVAQREYRFVSPVFRFSRDSKEIASLDSVGLVNRPNLKMTALCREGQFHEGQGVGDTDDADDDTPTATKDSTTMDKTKRIALCRDLGLADEAGDDAIISAVATLKADKAQALNRAETPALDKFVPRADFDALKAKADAAEQALNRIQGEKLEAEITALVDDAVKAGKVAPASKEFYLAMCRKGGTDEFKKFVASAPVLTGVSQIADKQPGNADGSLTDDEKAACRAMGLSEDDYKKAKGTKAA